MHVELSSALGFAKQAPVGCLVAGSTEAGEFNESLQQDGSVAIVLVPVLGESVCSHRQDAGREVVAADPGQDEEASVAYRDVGKGREQERKLY